MQYLLSQESKLEKITRTTLNWKPSLNKAEIRFVKVFVYRMGVTSPKTLATERSPASLQYLRRVTSVFSEIAIACVVNHWFRQSEDGELFKGMRGTVRIDIANLPPLLSLQEAPFKLDRMLAVPKANARWKLSHFQNVHIRIASNSSPCPASVGLYCQHVTEKLKCLPGLRHGQSDLGRMFR